MNASQAHTATGVSRSTIGRWIKAGKLTADIDGYFEEDDFNVLNDERLTKPGPGRKTGHVTIPKKKPSAKKKASPKKPVAPVKKKLNKKTKNKTTAKKKDSAFLRPTEEDLTNQARIFCAKANNYTVTYIQRQIEVGFNRAQRILTTLKREKVQSAEDEAGQSNEAELLIAKNSRSRQGVDMRKALANARKAEMEVEIKRKDLISRELISHVFRKIYTIDSTEWRGLGPRIAPDIMAICEVEDPTKEVEISDLVEQQVFRTLGHVKRLINSFLEDIESEERIDDER